jgi:hypothetical protein
MLSIDNSVELMVKTYLGLPKRVTGLHISRAEYAEANESFPRLLDLLEKYAVDKLDEIDLGEIDWYHRLRNELYHQGNGLTVERDKVVVYAKLAFNVCLASQFWSKSQSVQNLSGSSSLPGQTFTKSLRKPHGTDSPKRISVALER